MKKRTTHLLLVWFLVTTTVFGMKVGTYNIRNDNSVDVKNGNSWSQRAPVIASLIRFHDFDVIGTQEGFHHQMRDLENLMPEHAYTSFGRDDGELAGEHVGIFFKKDRFELANSGFFWLSETPDRPGKGWDADLPRICTWAKLRDKTTDTSFHFFTLHLDHRGSLARRESIRLVLRRMDELAAGGPVFLTGDFNTDQNSEAYQWITSSGRLIDAAESAEICYMPNGTPNNFDPNSETTSRIDHVFLSPDTRVLRFGILMDSYRIPKSDSDVNEQQSGNLLSQAKLKDHEARLPSDHFPVLVETARP